MLWFFAIAAILLILGSLPYWFGYAAHRTFILDALDQLAAAPEIPGPKFVFAHIIAPHPPFVLDADGHPLHPNYPYVTGDGASFVSNVDAYKQGYLGQVEYLNRRVLAMVGSILAKSATPPVIILQGDHGPGLLLMLHGDNTDTCLWERSSILNVYYFPQGQTDLLYPSISPINSFRTIFNTYFSISFEMQEDKTYFSLFEVPYNFSEITDQVREPRGTTP